MAKPSPAALEMAAEWLLQYDEESPEAALCFEVAKWLQDMVAQDNRRKVEAAAIRKIAKERGVTPAVIRKALATKRKAQNA